MVLCDKCNHECANNSILKRHIKTCSPKKDPEYSNKDLSNLTFIDLFCGVGGFHQALSKFDAKCVLACDIDKDCRVVYKDNYGIEPVPDVKKIDEKTMPDFDILCAGFPCFVAGTLVLTNSGYKKIEDVGIEEQLLTHTGKFQKILNLQSKIYTGKLYNISIKHHHEVITCTEEHPFYVRTKDGEPMWKKASELTNQDYLGMVINKNDKIPVNTEDKNMWFMMGYSLDRCSVDKILNVPESIQNAPKEYIQQFINGFIESRGKITDNIICIRTKYGSIAYNIQRLLLKLGYIFSVSYDNCEYIVTGKFENTYSDCFIDGNYAWCKIKDIFTEYTFYTQVYNFEVQEDNSYIVQNVIVHNCQAFSNGGKKKCFDDERGLLFDEIIRIASHKKPKFMFLENVKHILKVSDGKVIEYIKNKIDQTGYKLQLLHMSPHNYGIPQQRERVYFVCIRNDIYNGQDILLPPHKRCEDFTKFLDKNVDQKYFLKGDVLDVLNAWDEMVKQFEIGEKINPTIMIKEAYKTYTTKEFNDLPTWKRDYITKNKPLIKKYEKQFREWYEKHSSLLDKREIYARLDWQTGVIKPDDSIFNHFIQVRQSGIRVKKSEYFPTLVAISQIPIYGKEKRYITPRECARLQSFPEDFKLSPHDKITYKQMGNSINVDNVYTVIRATFEKYF
jgi:DNA (cytosine-5)-methyltransferase 1